MSITSRINEMSSHIEQAYDELQGLGADLTNVNKNIENISMVLDDIYDSMPQVSGEGTSLTLDDTRVGKIKSTLKGNTSQSGTPTPTSPIPVNVVSGDNSIDVCGKNLWGEEEHGGIDESTGVDFYNATRWRTVGFISAQPNTAYTISSNASSNIWNIFYYYDKNKNFISSKALIGTTSVNWTTPSNCEYMRCVVGDTATIQTTERQLELGNTATTYEPYQGNTYNIDLPVENLFNKDNVVANTGLTSEGGTFSNNNYCITGYIKVGGNISMNIHNEVNNKTKRVCYYTSQTESSFINVSEIPNNKVLSFTTPSNCQYIRLQVEQSDKDNTMLEYGSKQNNFTPYGTTPIELCKIGNYQDYIYKDNDKWYLHKEIGKYVLNGSENWNKSSTYQGNYYCQSTIPYAITFDVNCFSNLTNIFFNSYTQLSNGDNGIMLEGGGTNKTIDFKMSSITTLADFKTFLGNTNLILYYAYATPTTTEITYQPLIDQLNLLEKAMSKDGQTNISQVNNDLPFIISASALKEWQESASLNSTLSMVNPLSLGNTLNTQENNTQPIEVDNIEPLEEEENEES